MVRRTIWLQLLLMLWASVPMLAQKLHRVSSEYSYQSDNMDESRNQMLQKAFERARQEAIRKKFGERVDGETKYEMSVIDGHESVTFYQYGGTELRAEWIESIKEEVHGWYLSEDGSMFVVTVYVEGKVREVTTAGVDFEYHLLRNGTELPHCESTDFKNHDRVYLWFKAPTDGYLAVYLVDDELAYCALPYEEQTDGIYRIKANKEYVFFSKKHASEEEEKFNVNLEVATKKKSEINTLYVVFSPQHFTKKTDNNGDTFDGNLTVVRNVEKDVFLKWLSECRSRDLQMREKHTMITITK